MHLLAFWNRWLDRHDEVRARRMRSRLGARRWIVSWIPDSKAPASWRARVSAPNLDLTLERLGRTRMRAIQRACQALQMLEEHLEEPPLSRFTTRKR